MKPRSSSKQFRGTAIVLLFITVTLIYILATVSNDVQPFPYFMDANRSPPFDSHFFAWGERCRIPDVDHRHISILKYLKPSSPIVCSKRPPLTFTTLDQARSVLRVDTDIASQYIDSLDRLICCYSVITRATEDKNHESKCVNFTLKVALDVAVEFIYVRCRDKKKNKEVYTDMHAVVQKKPSNDKVQSEALSNKVATAIGDETSSDNGTSRPMNVMILGIDSMSRLNVMRTMPRTVAHLKSNDWLEFRGYNKIGDNTIPNLLAILMGKTLDQIRKLKCYPKKGVLIDKCPFIWKDFRHRGYLTAYAEDEPTLSTFNFNLGGFIKQPTDFYFRPFMLAATSKLKLVKRNNQAMCLGPKSTTEHFLKYTLDLIMTYEKLFGLIWLNNFSHNNHNTPAAVDEIFFKFMEELKASGALNDTIILFLSDHGARFGKIRETYVGWLEERLPFFFMWLPERFRETYPEAYQNVKDHGDLLTSPFDVHLTLKEILDDRVGLSVNGSDACPTCRSLFAAPIRDRSCEEAGITTHWCTCASQVSTSTSSEVVLNATKFALDEIMNKLNNAGNLTMTKCAPLELKTILSARIKESYNTKLKKMYKDYVVVFYTTPGLALFDATIRHNGPGEYEVMGFISRINSYEADSKCINDKELKLYCHCLSS